MNSMIFEEKMLLNPKCVFDFRYNCIWNISCFNKK